MNPNLKTVIVMLVIAAITFIPQKKPRAQDGQKMPMSVQRLLIKVRTAMDKGDYSAAIKHIRSDQAKSQSKTPCSHPIVCLALGNCCLIKKKNDTGRIGISDGVVPG